MHTLHGGHNAIVDRKTVERVMHKLDSLSQLKGVPQLQRSHPYLPEITRDIKAHLRLILEKTSNLGHNQYLYVTVHSLLSKTAECSEIVNKEGIMSRRTLTKHSLIFSHILCELRALFPGGRYQGSSYHINKPEASKFWKQKFESRCLVEWKEFRDALNSVHPVGEGPLESALRSTIDLTCNDHVSVFEFDIFTRLFQPWEILLQNWMLLAVTHPGYMAFLTYDEVKELLHGLIRKPGSYIFRLSCTHLGQWAIGYVTTGGNILQTIPHNKSLYDALTEGEREGLYLYPNGLNIKHDLSALSNPTANAVIQVTKEQWEVYSDMDSTFELCKICADSQKNTRIQPCGHLICDQCLMAWQKSDNTCPFCRTKITGSEEIHISSQPEPEEQAPTTSPQNSSEQPPQESAASNVCGSTFSGNTADEEEIDWIRNRPLPSPPDNPISPGSHLTTRLLPSVPTFPYAPAVRPVSTTQRVTHPVLPRLPRRVKLQAQDVIAGNRLPATRRT
ncbi:E3 ubiquitin-protein ligase CBL-C isoform X2 [Pseudophryne corroboree]|uniref:E3 ubiquitin-protein ligase CBL-C isoform X2 n=1 Tax=Pseudophryne corroboree TaxID=495146 RepID=UPI003081EDD8